jgi:hypothetical protein
LVRATGQESGEADPGQDREPAERLFGAERVAERGDARERADERLEVDERARELRGHAHLRPGEQPERGQRAGEAEPRHGGDRTARGGRGRRALEQHRDRQRRERGGAELHGRRRAGIAAGEQPRLDHDQSRRAGDRREHEQVAGERRAGAAAARDEADAGERDERAAPGGGARGRAPDRGGDDRHEHRHGADEQCRVTDARALDPGVLEQDHAAVAERAGARHRGRQRPAQAATRDQRQDRRGEGEARHGEPARAEPVEAELGQRHGEPPERARGQEREDRAAAAGRGRRVREVHGHIFGWMHRISSWI